MHKPGLVIRRYYIMADPGFYTYDKDGNVVSYHTGEGSKWDGPDVEGFHSYSEGDHHYNTGWWDGGHHSFDSDNAGNTYDAHTTDHSDGSITQN